MVASIYDDPIVADFARVEAQLSQGLPCWDMQPIALDITHTVHIVPGVDTTANSDSLFTLPSSHRDYMQGHLDDVSPDTIASWVTRGREAGQREFQGYRISDHLDLQQSTDREVSLVRGESAAYLPPHVHEVSDALFVITGGSAKFITLSTETVPVSAGSPPRWGGAEKLVAFTAHPEGGYSAFRYTDGLATDGKSTTTIDVSTHPIKCGDIMLVPKGMPHGFLVSDLGTPLEFISIQTPPIRDPHTGHEDFIPLNNQNLEQWIRRLITP